VLCKTIIVAKSEEVKPGLNLAESSKEGYASKMAVSPMMIMVMVMVMMVIVVTVVMMVMVMMVMVT
jgi:hypothetical protein